MSTSLSLICLAGRIHFMTNHQTPHRSFDPTISSTQETYTEPSAKRSREDDEPTIQEVTEIVKMLMENNPDLDAEQIQVKTTSNTQNEPAFIPKPQQMFKPHMMQQPHTRFLAPTHIISRPPAPVKPPMLDQRPKFVCRFCKKTLSTPAGIKKHENECQKNPDREKSTCDICHMELKPSSLAQHKNIKHPQPRSMTPMPITPIEDSKLKAQQLTSFNATFFNVTTPHPSSSPSPQLRVVETPRQSPDGSAAEIQNKSLPHDFIDVGGPQVKNEVDVEAPPRK